MRASESSLVVRTSNDMNVDHHIVVSEVAVIFELDVLRHFVQKHSHIRKVIDIDRGSRPDERVKEIKLLTVTLRRVIGQVSRTTEVLGGYRGSGVTGSIHKERICGISSSGGVNNTIGVEDFFAWFQFLREDVNQCVCWLTFVLVLRRSDLERFLVDSLIKEEVRVQIALSYWF